MNIANILQMVYIVGGGRYMKDRLKKIRKALGFNQTEMASELGVAQGTYSQYERGDRVFQPRYIETLKLKFNVNPKWLETGEGDMFVKTTQDEEFMAVYNSLSEESKKMIVDLIKKIKKSES